MRRNAIWITFLIIIALFALWFITKAGYGVFGYYHLSKQVPTTISSWSVEEIKSDEFAVVAHYSFEYQGKNYQQKSRVGGLYPNPWAANRAQKQFATQEWPAWLNPKHPEQAVLEKKFPYKRAISAAVLIGLLVYFALLSSYVRIKQG